MTAHVPPPADDPWAPGVRASDVPIARPLPANILVPNKADISAHLYALFAPAFVQDYPDAWIEIAFADPATGGPGAAENFSAFELQAAAEFAEKRNKAGFNIYVGAALRHGERCDRASGANVLTASHSWAEFDKPGDDARIAAILKEKNFPASMTVATGRTPCFRAHLYFRLAGSATPEELRATNTALKTLLGSDAVHNPDRVMRLAGTISYPPPKKVERGYITELVTLHIRKDARAYHADELIRLSQTNGATPNESDHGENGRRDDHELVALLEASRTTEWHNNVRDAIASMIGRGWSDLQIRLACAPYCEGGADDPDLAPLIEGARDKWGERGATLVEQAKRPPISATPFVCRDPATIPLRQYLYGKVLIRNFVSVVIGQTGLGKSTLSAAETLAQVTAKNLLGVYAPEPLRVWVWNLEDPQEETERKIAAVRLHYGLTAEDIGDRLFVDSGRDQPLVIAEMTRNGAMIVRPVVDGLVAELIRLKIDIIKIDPFVSSHTVPENDNGAMDMIVKEWGRVADCANCAVELYHHPRKTNGAEVTAEDGRGGSSFVSGTRVKRPLNRMTQAEGDQAGVTNYRLYFRILPDTSLAPPLDKSDWYKLVSVDLGNGPLDGPGDSVGVVTKWEWPDPLAGMTAADFDKVAAVIRAGKWRESPQASKWVGNAVAKALDMNADNKADKAKILGMLKAWRAAGSLVVVEGQDEKSMVRKFVEVKEEG